MFLAGDEFRRTQRGNNNAYCQDNRTSWVDWSLCERHSELVDFARRVLSFRRMHPVLRREAFYTDREIQWFDPGGRSPDWLDASQKCLACWIHGQEEPDLYLIFNADIHPTAFVLPELPRAERWRLAIDTAQRSLETIDAAGEAAMVLNGPLYTVASRCSVILAAGSAGP
jgi:glycogen operon protein